MSERILFCDSWLFHEGEIAQQPPASAEPQLLQLPFTHHECRRKSFPVQQGRTV